MHPRSRFLFLLATFVALCTANICRAASFNCSSAQSMREKLVCSNAELSSLDEKLATAYKAGRSQLTESSASLVQQDQRDWLSWLDKVCPAHDNRGDDPARCLINHYTERLQQLRTGGVPINGTRLYTRAHFIYVPGQADPSAVSDKGFGEGQFAWPQIDNPTPAQKAWNDAVYQAALHSVCCMGENQPKTLDASVDPQSTISTSFVVHAANAHFLDVGLDVDDYEGGAHGMYSSATFAWWLDAERPLQDDDIFSPASGWQQKLAALTLAKLLIDPGPDALWQPGPYTTADQLQKAVADGVVQTSAWDVSAQGLTITFGEYAVGPYSSGMPSATFRWQELTPLLAPSFHPEQLPAPLPQPPND
jgi:uncharacterized protein